MYDTLRNMVLDREKYPFVGQWKNSDNDIWENINYYYVENKSYRLGFNGRIQGITSTARIAVFGYHKFVPNDTIILDDGVKMRITDITAEVKEQVNLRIIHLVKPRVIEQVLTLE